MRKMFLILASLFCLSTLSAQDLTSVKVEDVNGDMIDVTSLIDGETPMIISFWSTTCKPCIKELDAIYDAMPDWLDGVEFRMIAVSVDDARSLSRAKSMSSSRWGDSFTLLFDKNQDFKRAMNVNLTPQVFIFDKNGKQIYSHTGYIPGGESELIEKLEEL